MISYMAANWATSFLVIIMQFLCGSVFSLIQLFCSAFMNLATLEISTGFINDFMDRIYIVVGIYMLFKFCFSLLTAVVNPDKLTDKEKGFGKMVQRTIVSLVMLILVPIVFSKALGWQARIALMVPRLIVGSEITNATESNTVGSQLASDALKPFITVNKECVDAGGDKESLKADLNGTNNVNETISLSLVKCSADKGIFAYEFSGIVATVVGIILVVILASYCIEMAIRVIKLGILRVIAPIPIISYIDPKSEKGGSFSNWIKECVSTYIDLFIKLAIFYFVLEILGGISSESISFFENSDNLGPLAYVFLILGAFFFMGKASDFICNLLGIKSQKGGGLLGKTLAGIGGVIAGAGLGAGAALITGGGLAGAAAAALGGAATGIGGKPLGAFNKGREIAANIQGKEKPTSMIQKAQSSIMRRQAAKMGITDESLDKAKAARDVASSRFDLAESLLHQAPDGAMIEWGDKKYSKEKFAELVYEGKNSLKAEMLKRKSTYDEMKAQGAKWHVGKAVETYSDKYRAARNKGDLSDYTPDVSAYKAPENRRIVMPTPVNPSQQEVIPKNIPMDYETKSGILLNPSAEKSKQIMDEARKKGQIK